MISKPLKFTLAVTVVFILFSQMRAWAVEDRPNPGSPVKYVAGGIKK